MTPNEFLRAVWPDEGVYCLALRWTPPNQTRSVWVHKTYDSIDDVSAYVAQIRRQQDIYFCVHTLREHRVWNPNKRNAKTGELGAHEVRVQTNTKAAKAFFFDLDVGSEPEKYQDQREAIFALQAFCKTVGLPRPLLVGSGRGLHAYWLLDEALPSDQWRADAAKLKALAHQHGLKVDNSRTVDTASVLRVAGTLNFKDPSNPLAVYAMTQGRVTPLDDFQRILNSEAIKGGIEITAPRSAPQGHSLLGVQDGPEFDAPPVSIKAVSTACKQMQRFMTLRGNVSEPEWYHGIVGVGRFLKNGPMRVHQMSQGYPGYDPAVTDAKITQHEQRRSHDGRPLGPTGCAKLQEVIAADAVSLCDGCSFKGRVHGPIQAGRLIESAPDPVIQQVVGPTVISTTVPPPPRPYTRMASGGISMHTTASDGEEIHAVIYEHDLYPIRRLVNAQSEVEQQVWRVVLPRRGAKDFIIDADALYDRRKFTATMANQGIYPSTANLQHVQEYMVAYISQLQKLADADVLSNHLGWTEDRNQFILPDKVIHSDGTAKPAMLSLGAQRSSAQVRKSGTLQRQIELLRFYNDPAYVAQQFFVLGSLAAPLFYMTGHHGIIINASGDAGASKSTSLYTAASLWGQPELYTINGTQSGATVRGRNERVSTLANLPICVDEITHIPIKEVQDLAMSITQPGHRIRLNSDGIERSSIDSYKATIMLTTANSSLHNLLSLDNSAGTAGSMRVFEIMFRSLNVHRKFEADDFLQELMQNYGHIGEAFISYVIRHTKAFERRVREVQKEVDILCNIQSSERFWSAAIAVIVVACEIANQQGLLSFDRDAIFRWATGVQMNYMRGVVVEEYNNPLGVLADYLEQINGDIIVVEKPMGSGNIPNVSRVPRGQMLGHWNREERSMWVLKKAFKDYCTKIGANSTKVLAELSEPRLTGDGEVSRIVTHKNVKKVLGAGTEYAKAQTWCFAVNMAHPDITGLPSLTIVRDTPKPAVVMPGVAKASDG